MLKRQQLILQTMTTINLKINKEAFDLAIPAAREPKGHIFGQLQDKIDTALQSLATFKLGDVGTTAVNNDLQGPLAKALLAYASVEVFLSEMHDLDVVLTSTGFGVVSSNDLAPASKIRVDALDGELRVKRLCLEDEIRELLFRVKDWYQQGIVVFDTLFCQFKFLRQFAGYQAPISKDWELAMPVILETDRWLRDKISDEFMDEMISQMATNSLSDKNKGIVHQIRRIIGVAVQGNKGVMYEYYRRLMNTLESDLDSFQTYANSKAFETNHFKPYENKRDAGAFHFVG